MAASCTREDEFSWSDRRSNELSWSSGWHSCHHRASTPIRKTCDWHLRQVDCLGNLSGTRHRFSPASEEGILSKENIFARQQIERSHRLRIAPLPSDLPSPLGLFPAHIIQRLLKHTLPLPPIILHRIRLPQRLNRQTDPLHVVELGARARRPIVLVGGDPGQDLADAVLGRGEFADDDAGEQERLVGEVVDVVGFVDAGVGDDAVGVGADGGLDVVFGGGEDAGEGEGSGDVLWAEEEGVVVGVRVFGEGVEGEVQTGFVPHGWGSEGFEWGGGGGGRVGGKAGWCAGFGFRDEGILVCVRVTGTWNVHARLIVGHSQSL